MDTPQTPRIVFEDDHMLALLKPSGWITNKASTTKNQPVLQKWIEDNLDFEISKNEKLRSGIVHRLDKETSGIILVAKNEEIMRALQSKFKQREVKKKYTALAHNVSAQKEGTIDAPVGRLPWRRDRFGVLPGGRSATTHFKVKHLYARKEEKFTLFELEPVTGRTHQIRIHLKYINHPIVGDHFYAGRKTARNDRKWCPRLFLHASSIELSHPKDDTKLKLTADLPSDLQSCLDTLKSI